MSQNVRSIRWEVAVLRAAPSLDAPPSARIDAVLRVVLEDRLEEPIPGKSENLVLSLYTVNADRSDEPRLWMDVGEYSTYVPGVRALGEWIQLIGPSLPANAWLRRTSPFIRVINVEPLQGQIVWLDPFVARWPDGSHRLIDRGSYLVTAVTDDAVTFRAEIPTDFDCGEEVQPPPELPPTLRAAPQDLFHEDGSARFAPVYTKGC
jgi:hypothetical protein